MTEPQRETYVERAFLWLNRGRLDRLDRRLQLAINLAIVGAAWLAVVLVGIAIDHWLGLS